MKLLKSTVILLLLASLSFVSCDDEPLEGTFTDELNIDNNSAANSSADTFFAKVDGVELVETRIDVATVEPENTTNYYSIVGVVSENTSLGLSIPTSFEVGNHAIGTTVTSGNTARAYYLLSGSLRNSTTGELVITEKTSSRIKGTFNFTAPNFSGSEVNVITEGAFDVAYN